MRRSLTISLLAIVAVAIVALVATFASGDSPRLGLDLQGGASVVLQPTKQTASGAINQALKIITNRVNAAGVSEASITKQGSTIVVEMPGVKNPGDLINRIGKTAQLEFRAVITNPTTNQPAVFNGPGPSAATNPSTTAAPAAPTTTAVPAATPPPTTAATPTTKGALGTTTPVVAAAAAATAVPAATPTTAVPTSAATASTAPAPTVAPGATPPKTAPTTAPVNLGPAITPDSQISPDSEEVLPQLDPKTGEITARYVVGPILRDGNYLLTGQIVSSANAVIDPTTGQWSVHLNFTGKGGNEWDKIVGGQYFGQQVAIILDNQVQSAPSINAHTFGGSASITGNFTHSDASRLALVLKYGALPVQFNQGQVQTVSATLGKNSLSAGLVAGLIGLGLVLLYMILYYRALGIVVVLGLSLSASLLYSLVTYLGASSLHQALSLSGVVGIIVSVGVTVDSYIVYFERLKDDIRAGKSIRASVDKSFARAWRTIWTADLVSIIAAGLLFWLTVGDVRGFAFFLGLSTLLDLVVSYMFTRPMVFLLGRNRTFTEARFLGVARGLAAAPAGGAG